MHMTKPTIECLSKVESQRAGLERYMEIVEQIHNKHDNKFQKMAIQSVLMEIAWYFGMAHLQGPIS